MPERNTESAPVPSPHLPKVWETGETLDQSPIPGTRRLWLAGALLLAVLASTVTTVALLDEDKRTSAKDRTENTSAQDEPLLVAPPVAATAPSGKSGLSAASPSVSAQDGSASPAEQRGGGDPVPKPSSSKSTPASGGKPPAAKPSSARKSVQSVNYPDRHWRVDHDSVRLDRVDAHGSSRTGQEASFRLVPGLADADCVSFSLGNGRYLRHAQFRLRADRRDGSELFEKDATFCPRPSAFSGAVMLESVNYRGRFLRHRDFRLRLDPYENSRLYQADSAFRLVKGLG
ncbi:AbfB domain-containing protein [Streptomyces sp. NPDC057621]|uniref:AbfB domain-containing protein n=1 Tax=Streptomyces sp. NPDC057621 TaxID=3346186 RepID=UPI0036B57597